MQDFEEWYQRAGVRGGSRRILSPANSPATVMFPPNLIPYYGHPLLDHVRFEKGHELLTRHLYQYLWFTIHFETQIVNRVTQTIASGSTGFDIPRDARLDALKIYTDEGYHALFSMDLVQQLEIATGIEGCAYTFADYRNNVDRVAKEQLPEDGNLAQFLQVVVFETVISSLLDQIPRHPNVVPVVRDLVADHARDERFHHAYFSQLFQSVWTQLSSSQKDRVALALPALIHASLAPYLGPVRDNLQALGLSRKSAMTIVADAYGGKQLTQATRLSCKHTVKLFERTGVLDRAGALDAFEAAGLHINSGIRERN